MAKPSDTQVILLSNASQRDNGSLYPLPDKHSEADPRVIKALAGLLSAGLAEEREASDFATLARTDGDVGYGLFATSAALAAIGLTNGLKGARRASPKRPRRASPSPRSCLAC
jgi:hypothetical protein